MEFVVNTNTIIGIAGLVTALGVLIGSLYKAFLQYHKWENYDKKIDELKTHVDNKNAETKADIKTLKDEQYMQTKVLLATLDGLHQLGCNGKVTEASNELTNFLNAQSHR